MQTGLQSCAGQPIGGGAERDLTMMTHSVFRNRLVTLMSAFSLVAIAPYAVMAEDLTSKTAQSKLEQYMYTDFETLMQRVSDGWTNQNVDLALSAFTDDAVYTEPPNFQIYRGRTELRNFFNAVRPGSSMIWHHLWYNPETGVGAGEYSFHNGGRNTAVHGVAVVEITNGKIRIWREYQRRGEIDYDAFHDPADKNWETTGAFFE